MSVRAFFETNALPSQSPYRLLSDEANVDWANEFLDAQRVRGLSLRSLRAYAYDLVHIARWLEAACLELSGLTEARLTDYIGYQLRFEPQPAAQTINHRLCVARCLYRFHFGCEIPARGKTHGCALSSTPHFGYARRRRLVRGLGVKVPRRVVVPLTLPEIAEFWSGFRTYRDLGIVSLMLFCGLRSCEVLSLQLEDLDFSQKQILVLGKGNRQRMVPLDAQVIEVVHRYLVLERPKTNSSFVFVVLKGPNRGSALKPAGLRTVFRHHRIRSRVGKANPHRFRHTFGADMVRAGISLPALMKLMGHSHIHTTMLYVQLCPKDVWREFHRAIDNRERPPLPETP